MSERVNQPWTKQFLSEILCSLLCVIAFFLIDEEAVRLVEERTLWVIYRLFLYLSVFYETSTYWGSYYSVCIGDDVSEILSEMWSTKHYATFKVARVKIAGSISIVCTRFLLRHRSHRKRHLSSRLLTCSISLHSGERGVGIVIYNNRWRYFTMEGNLCKHQKLGAGEEASVEHN